MNESFVFIGSVVFDLFALGIIFAVIAIAKAKAMMID